MPGERTSSPGRDTASVCTRCACPFALPLCEDAFRGGPVGRRVDRQRLRGVDDERLALLAVDVAEAFERLPSKRVYRAVARIRGSSVLPPGDARALRQKRLERAA